jgi:hypothetical protein
MAPDDMCGEGEHMARFINGLTVLDRKRGAGERRGEVAGTPGVPGRAKDGSCLHIASLRVIVPWHFEDRRSPGERPAAG